MFENRPILPLPKPEMIYINPLKASENTYDMPEDLITDKSFNSFVKHCVLNSQSRGFYVIKGSIRHGEREMMKSSITLVLKVAKLPEPNLHGLGIHG